MYKRLLTRIEQYFSKEMWKLIALAVPIIGSSILHMAYNFTDMIWVGKIGVGAVASVGTAGFFVNLGWAFASIIVVGVSVKVAHSIGGKNKKAAGKYATAGLWGLAGLTVIFTSLLLSIPDQLIAFFKLQDQKVIDDAIAYLIITAAGGFLSFATILFTGIFNAYGFTKLSFRASLFGTLTNIILDPLFIFGLDMGVEGAAYATIAARTMGLMPLLYFTVIRNKIRFTGFWPKMNRLAVIMRIGFPTSIQRISFTIIYIVLARIIADWGVEAIAVQKIGVQIEAITFMLVYGILQAVSITVGQQYGAKKYNEIPLVYIKGLKLAFSIGLVTSLLFLFIPDVLFSIFVDDPATIKMGVYYLRILAVSQLFMCLEMMTSGAFHGLGKTQFPAIVSVTITSLRIPLAFYLGFYTVLELHGVWWSISITSVLKGIILFAIFYRVIKQLNKNIKPVKVF
jgi:putative MATE family efflux protein